MQVTIPDGIKGGFVFTVFQRNLKEWHEKPLMPVLLKGNYLQKLQCIDHIPNYLSGLSRAHFLG